MVSFSAKNEAKQRRRRRHDDGRRRTTTDDDDGTTTGRRRQTTTRRTTTTDDGRRRRTDDDDGRRRRRTTTDDDDGRRRTATTTTDERRTTTTDGRPQQRQPKTLGATRPHFRPHASTECFAMLYLTAVLLYVLPLSLSQTLCGVISTCKKDPTWKFWRNPHPKRVNQWSFRFQRKAEAPLRGFRLKYVHTGM